MPLIRGDKINTKARMGPLAPILPNWLVIGRRFSIRSDHPSAFVFEYLGQHSESPVAQVHDTNGDVSFTTRILVAMDVDDPHPPGSSNLGKRASNDDWEQHHHTPKSARSENQPDAHQVESPAESQRNLLDRLNTILQSKVSTRLQCEQ